MTFGRPREDHITVKDLTLAFGERILMQALSFTIRRGEVFCIMGASGSGKSTLMRYLIGIEEATTGEICLGQTSLVEASVPDREALIRRMGVMYQGGALWSSMTLAENIALPLEQFTDLSRREIHRIVSYKLALVGLEGFEDFYPSEISGGMTKRAAVARALSLDPEVLLLDEPSSGLDPLSTLQLDELILELRKSTGLTVVVVSHELESISRICDRAIFLDRDKKTIGAAGTIDELKAQRDYSALMEFLEPGQGTAVHSGAQPAMLKCT